MQRKIKSGCFIGVGNGGIKFLAGTTGEFLIRWQGRQPGTGTTRPVKHEGGSNFKTPPADGICIIKLDENKQTGTIINLGCFHPFFRLLFF